MLEKMKVTWWKQRIWSVWQGYWEVRILVLKLLTVLAEHYFFFLSESSTILLSQYLFHCYYQPWFFFTSPGFEISPPKLVWRGFSPLAEHLLQPEARLPPRQPQSDQRGGRGGQWSYQWWAVTAVVCDINRFEKALAVVILLGIEIQTNDVCNMNVDCVVMDGKLKYQ